MRPGEDIYGCLLFSLISLFMLQELPINIKFCFEGMEESGSEGLDELVFARKDTFLKDVDYVCISDNYWLGNTKPCITYGLRGICYFFIEVESDCHDSDCNAVSIKTCYCNALFQDNINLLYFSSILSICVLMTFGFEFKGGVRKQGPTLWSVWWLCS